jgi:hypothetical protein
LADLRKQLSEAASKDDLTLNDLPLVLRQASDYVDPGPYFLPDAFEQRRDSLLPIIDDILERRMVDARRERGRKVETWQNGIDDETFKEDVVRRAKTYVDNGWMHCPALTNLIATAVMDAEILPLRRTLANPTGLMMGMMRADTPAFSRMIKVMEMPDEFDRIGVWIRRILEGLGILVALMLLAGGIPLLGIPLAAFIGWRIFRRRKVRVGYAKAREETISAMRTILAEMESIRAEIASGAYSPSRIMEKLRNLEDRGGFVASILYDVISIGSGTLPPPASSSGKLLFP